MADRLLTKQQQCPQIGDVIYCQCGKPSRHYGTMGVRGAREVKEEAPPAGALTSKKCTRFQDDPDAPGCCIGCGDAREAHMNLKQKAMSMLSRLVNNAPIGKYEAHELVRQLLEAKWNEPSSDETKARHVQRTPMDYALEHAEYLALAAEGFIEDVNNLDGATMAIEEDDSDTTRHSLQEAFDHALEARSAGMSKLRNRVYEFRKRAERAKGSAQETYTNEAPSHPPILPERFNSVSLPENGSVNEVTK